MGSLNGEIAKWIERASRPGWRRSEPLKNKMPKDGLEPSRGCPHWILNPARLPIPPLRHYFSISYKIERCNNTSSDVSFQENITQVEGYYNPFGDLKNIKKSMF